MSTSMPQFEMPESEVPAPPARERAAQAPPPTTVRPAHTAEPDAAALESRRGTGWRQLLAAGVVGLIVGAAIPGGIELGERAAASADEASLRAVAADYLAAIAEGRASDASAMVPLPAGAREAPDAALQSAEPIGEAEVQLVHIDGDIASVEVRFEVGAVGVARTLDAERVAGAWWLTTPLAERIEPIFFGPFAEVSLAGFPLSGEAPVHLYPGLYVLDEVAGPIVRVRSERFSVDGDPSTQTQVHVEAGLAPEIEAHASAVALAVARECQAARDCPIPAALEVMPLHTAIFSSHAGAVDLGVQLTTDDQQWFDVRMSVSTDEDGEPSEWRCARPGSLSAPTEPCPEVP